MKVTPLEGEWFRFHVPSQEGNGTYLVDLENHDFNGECDCPHFRCRLEPLLKERGPSEATRCKHINAARNMWFDRVARMVVRSVEKQVCGNEDRKQQDQASDAS